MKHYLQHWHSYSLLLLVNIMLAACSQTTTTHYYLSIDEKKQMLLPLEQKIDQELGGDYSNLVLKFDLLQLDQQTYAAATSCPISPFFLSLATSKVTRAEFQNTVNQLNSNFEYERTNNSLQHTLYQNARNKTLTFKQLFHNAKITAPELSGNTTITALLQPDYTTASPYNAPNSVDTITLLAKLATLQNISTLIDVFPILTPLPGSHVTSAFSLRKDPLNGRVAKHDGIDFVNNQSTIVHSAAAGRVIRAGKAGTYGNLVIIDHGMGITTRYAHLKKILVAQGTQVSMGEVIGVEGNTGRTTGPHLHYEMRINNVPRDPAMLLRLGTGCVL